MKLVYELINVPFTPIKQVHSKCFIETSFNKDLVLYIYRLYYRKKSLLQQETLRVVTNAMICFTLASLWKFQYFRWPIEHVWSSFYCKNSKRFHKKSSVTDARLGSKYKPAFTWRLSKCFISLTFLHYQALEICDLVKVLYFF